MAYLDETGLAYLWSKLTTRLGELLTQAKESGEFTPKKGEDYFTETDKQEFVSDVIEALPKWQGGSY